MSLGFQSCGSGKASKVIGALAGRILARASKLAFRRVEGEFRYAIAESYCQATTTTVISRNVCDFLGRSLFVSSGGIQYTWFGGASRAIVSISSSSMRVVRIEYHGASTVRLCR